MNAEPEKMGARIRESSGWSVTVLARRIKIAPRTLQNLENGIIGSRMSVDVLIELAQVFNIKISDLFL